MKFISRSAKSKVFLIFLNREFEIFKKNFSRFFFSYISSIFLISILVLLIDQNEIFILNNSFDLEAWILLKKINNLKLIIFFLIFSSGWFFVSQFQLIDEKENFYNNYIYKSSAKYFFFFVSRFISIYIPFLIFFFFIILILNCISVLSYLEFFSLIFSSKIIFLNMIIFFQIQNISSPKKIQQSNSYILKILLMLVNIPSLILGLCSGFLISQFLILIFISLIGLILNYILVFHLILKK
jgi:hypothetical protein